MFGDTAMSNTRKRFLNLDADIERENVPWNTVHLICPGLLGAVLAALVMVYIPLMLTP